MSRNPDQVVNADPRLTAPCRREAVITADPSSELGYWCRKVDSMSPGQRLNVSWYALRDICSYEHNGATFTPADRILGNIVGSAYTHSYHIDHERQCVTFMRHEDTGKRHYEDPDRRRPL